MKTVHQRLPAFFILVFLLSAPFLIVGAFADQQLLPGLPVAALMAVCPGLAALIIAARDGQATALLAQAIRPGAWRWYLPALLIMPALSVLAFLIARTSGHDIPLPEIDLTATAGMTVAFLFMAFAEELGWTGYATTPLRQKVGSLGAAIILGLIWSVFHIVALLQADRSAAWIAWWAVGTVAQRVIIVWLYVNSGRVLVATVFHAASNLCWQLYPVQGSHYDPQIIAPLTAAAALMIVAVSGPSLAGWRARTSDR